MEPESNTGLKKTPPKETEEETEMHKERTQPVNP
jgi:hypothetical protein